METELQDVEVESDGAPPSRGSVADIILTTTLNPVAAEAAGAEAERVGAGEEEGAAVVAAEAAKLTAAATEEVARVQAEEVAEAAAAEAEAADAKEAERQALLRQEMQPQRAMQPSHAVLKNATDGGRSRDAAMERALQMYDDEQVDRVDLDERGDSVGDADRVRRGESRSAEARRRQQQVRAGLRSMAVQVASNVTAVQKAAGRMMNKTPRRLVTHVSNEDGFAAAIENDTYIVLQNGIVLTPVGC